MILYGLNEDQRDLIKKIEAKVLLFFELNRGFSWLQQ